MTADTFAAFYARYVEQCRRAGVEPVTGDRAAELLADLGTPFVFPAVHDEARGSGAGLQA